MSITLQAIVLVAAVVALSVVAVDSLDIWEWEKFAQNDGTVSEYTADKSVYASDADAEKSATISVTGTATASVDPHFPLSLSLTIVPFLHFYPVCSRQVSP